MKFDTSFTITAIIAFIALLSPIVTAIINNHYLTKQKTLEYSETARQDTSQHKQNLFEQFLSASGKFISIPVNTLTYKEENEVINEFSIACCLIVPYLDDDDQNTMNNFSYKISNFNRGDTSNSDVRNYFNDFVVPIIQKELQKL